jgi:Family of unknown function (DUF5990)/Domain of unknown function (DUF5655)
MPALPRRPDLDQLRRQARELLRAAAASDEQALRRIGVLSQKQTLSAAQLAIAREYGFASWPRLRAEVVRRQAGTEPDTGAKSAPSPDTPATESAPKSWPEMREWCARMLQARTGQGVAAWNERIAAGTAQNRAGEPALRTWLSAEGVTGYAQALLVWETFGYPRFLVADTEQLIGRQYADRPHLRPVFDAVLAALAALPGPVTVQARGTLVSLVSPRRTFAVLKPTTKARVDLGLRLDTTRPEGRLQPARDLGMATVRIPLVTPGEVDAEVRDWLAKAYDENTAPPAGTPRPPARPEPVLGTMTVVIEGSELPGLTCQPEPDGTVHSNIHVALATTARGIAEGQSWLTVPLKPGLAVEPFPGDAEEARWEVTVTVRGSAGDGYDFTGPSVGGDRTDRHLALVWGDVPGDGTLQLFRGAKLRLIDVPPDLITDAMRPGRRLVARVRLTDDRGNPVCARLRRSHLAWSAEPARTTARPRGNPSSQR